MSTLLRLVADRSASSAAEMAMAMPLLLVLIFGSFELGNYFLSEHVVQKSVRDAARYAARLPMTDYPSCAPTATAESEIQRVARTGTPDGTGTVRIIGWTADTMTTVTVACDTSGTYTGIYATMPGGVPVVTVTSTVPYSSLFGVLGLGNLSLTLNGRSESAVFGA